jgi:hypothetical protein
MDYSFLDEVLGDDATDSSLEISSHDSMPALEDIADEIHHEQDAEPVDETMEDSSISERSLAMSNPTSQHSFQRDLFLLCPQILPNLYLQDHRGMV